MISNTGGSNYIDVASLRGTAATAFYRLGLDDAQVADIVGWSESSARGVRKAYVTNAARAESLVMRINNARVTG